MQFPYGAGVLGVGMAVPARVLTNAELEQVVNTSDEWIRTRTGIRERRIAGEGETPAVLGAEAAGRALADAGVRPGDVDLVLCATTSGDFVWPATACLIQDALGARRAAAFDVAAACSGFTYALATAAAFVQSGAMRTVVVVGADTLSRQLDWSDRSTCILFGDGAGAAVVGRCAAGEGVLASSLGSDGGGAELIYIPAGGSRTPLTPELLAQRRNKIAMCGPEVFRFAVRIIGAACAEALDRTGLAAEDVSLLVPHQANTRIIRAAAERMGLSEGRVFSNVERYGNTSAASIPIALAEIVQQRRVRRGDVVATVGFGAGLTWGANVLRWCRDEPVEPGGEVAAPEGRI